MQHVSWIVKAMQTGMGGKHTSVGPFKDLSLAEQTMASMASMEVGSRGDVWTKVWIEEVQDGD